MKKILILFLMVVSNVCLVHATPYTKAQLQEFFIGARSFINREVSGTKFIVAFGDLKISENQELLHDLAVVIEYLKISNNSDFVSNFKSQLKSAIISGHGKFVEFVKKNTLDAIKEQLEPTPTVPRVVTRAATRSTTPRAVTRVASRSTTPRIAPEDVTTDESLTNTSTDESSEGEITPLEKINGDNQPEASTSIPDESLASTSTDESSEGEITPLEESNGNNQPEASTSTPDDVNTDESLANTSTDESSEGEITPLEESNVNNQPEASTSIPDDVEIDELSDNEMYDTMIIHGDIDTEKLNTNVMDLLKEDPGYKELRPSIAAIFEEMAEQEKLPGTIRVSANKGGTMVLKIKKLGLMTDDELKEAITALDELYNDLYDDNNQEPVASSSETTVSSKDPIDECVSTLVNKNNEKISKLLEDLYNEQINRFKESNTPDNHPETIRLSKRIKTIKGAIESGYINSLTAEFKQASTELYADRSNSVSYSDGLNFGDTVVVRAPKDPVDENGVTPDFLAQ